MDAEINSLRDKLIFSNLDTNRGYWWFEIDRADSDKTAFTLRHEQFRFSNTLFGLRKAPGPFQQTMDKTSLSIKWHFGPSLLEHITIFSRNADEYKLHLGTLQWGLHKSGVILNLKKSKFFTERIYYLEYIIGPKNGIGSLHYQCSSRLETTS